ncbi:TetR/AcrR family transcriptional regulator [Methylobacterium sp. Leaf93]|uniref:TetR/AcrR family transcriptional regulator n=1 Tax=Methylobacterium sp. Leaf93 TaxID=1736249 RepID=UPI0006F1D4D7|nr:TetR/AcrR family transcriptional regulator [Methylobacterium sp. Leaf93]KQP03961.1 TetR family transcriptional regulator [Methylobacterium sp. Leaf93]
MAKPRTRREDRPSVILDAAESLIRRAGTRTLTIDAVAAEAGLSKGGVLHHFSSKEALITAMAERKLKEVKEGIAKLEAEQVPGPSALPLALIAHARQVYAEEEGFPRAFLLASAENPEAFAGFNAFLSERLAALEKIETCPGIGAALVFSTLGLLISRTLGFHSMEGAQLERLFDGLEKVARCVTEGEIPPDACGTP